MNNDRLIVITYSTQLNEQTKRQNKKVRTSRLKGNLNRTRTRRVSEVVIRTRELTGATRKGINRWLEMTGTQLPGATGWSVSFLFWGLAFPRCISVLANFFLWLSVYQFVSPNRCCFYSGVPLNKLLLPSTTTTDTAASAYHSTLYTLGALGGDSDGVNIYCPVRIAEWLQGAFDPR